MGAYVDWYGDTQTVVATKDDKVVTAKIDDTKLYINDEVKTLDVPPMIIDGRTLVPARFVAESFGANVDWDGATQTVVIMTNDLFGKIDIQFIEGFELAKFSKYNSPASQNGLGDTPIYINCVITKTEVMKAGEYQMILGYLKDDGGNQWLAMLNATVFDNESTFKKLVGKDLVFCGVYSGYSDAKSMPVVELTQLCVKDTGDVITGIAALTN